MNYGLLCIFVIIVLLWVDPFFVFRHIFKQKIEVLKQEKTSLEHRLSLSQSDFKSAEQSNASLKKRFENAERQLQEVWAYSLC